MITKLTSKEARQYQQKTCLHLLHNIWAQPSSFSMGTLHMGQHLIKSESNVGMSCVVGGGHGFPGCHVARHPEQNSVWQVGHITLCGRERSPTSQTVSHPGFGHHIRLLSNSTSVQKYKNNE